MEHRWGRRQATDVKVRFVAAPAKIGTGRVVNISSTGAFMETRMALRVLSVVYLSAGTLRTAGKPRVKGMPACVVRRDAAGVGLEWCESVAGQTSVNERLALLLDNAQRPDEALPPEQAARESSGR